MEHLSKNKTKIVATLGPTSESKEQVKELILAGLNVARLNFSHGSHESQLEKMNVVRELNRELGRNVGILQDLQGPKIRIGDIENGEVEICDGDILTITSEPLLGNKEIVSTTFTSLADDVHVGEPILIDDGNLELKVISKQPGKVKTQVVHGGLLRSKKGINLPGTKLSVPSMTEKDLADLEYGLKHNVDWIALSFVRTADDIRGLKRIISSAGKHSKIIAKIEKPEAVDNIDEIIQVSDGIMVARGDLGVEIPMEKVPMIQKEIIKKCNRLAKPVIVATQMLDSMIQNPRPTRAETSDVANAIMDGADAVMLSGETAYGSYPVLAIEAMTKIISSVEQNDKLIYHRNYELEKNSATYRSDRVLATACRLSKDTDAKAITGMTFSGYTAFVLSRFRPTAEIHIFTENEQLLTQMSLIWGVRGFFVRFLGKTTEDAFLTISEYLRGNAYINEGDLVVSTGTLPIATKSRTNTIRLTIV